MSEQRASSESTRAMEALKKTTAKALKSARGNDAALRAAVAAFIKRGREAQMGGEGLNAFLAADQSNAIDLAGYSEEDAFRVMEIFDELMEELYRRNPAEGEAGAAAG